MRQCLNCLGPMDHLGPAFKYCSMYCKKRRAALLAQQRGKPYKTYRGWDSARQASYQKRRAMKHGVDAERIVPRDVYERDRWMCGICLGPVNPELRHPDPASASLDHRLPLAHGGSHKLSNVQCSHLRCNRSKGDSLTYSNNNATPTQG